MNSIYNDDITIRNTDKRNNMSNNNDNNKNDKNNKRGLATLSAEIIAESVEAIVRDAEDRDEMTVAEIDILLEAARRLHRVAMTGEINNDWQNSALQATEQRDRLRIREAELEARIDLLNGRVRDLERCVLQNALDAAMLRRRDQEESTETIIFHAGRTVERAIDHERHNDETGFENGEL